MAEELMLVGLGWFLQIVYSISNCAEKTEAQLDGKN